MDDHHISISHWGMFPSSALKLEPYPFPMPNKAVIKTLVARYRSKPIPDGLVVWNVKI